MAPNSYIINGERVSADQYNKEKYEDLRIRVPKGRKAEIKVHADIQGKSVNAFVIEAIDEKIEREKEGKE